MAAGALTEQAVETVANNLEQAAVITRQVNQHVLRYFFGGIGVGGVLGFVSGYKFTKEKTRAEVLKEAEKEIAEVREIYRQKAVALDNEMGKSKVENEIEGIVESEGYTSANPPNSPTVKYKTEYKHYQPSVVEPEPEIVVNEVFTEAVRGNEEKSKNDDWDYAEELKHRQSNPRLPYIIHQDEFAHGTTGYKKATYTYYAPDEVLVDEGGTKIENPARFVGVENLEQFGHGSDDYDVVFIRNNALQLEIEVCRIPNHSHEEHVLGLSRDDVEPS